MNRIVFAALALVTVAPVAASARPTPQPQAEAIIYRDRNFTGPAVNVSQPESNLRLSWPVRSVRLLRGTMEMCSAANFRGTCATVTRSMADTASLLLPGNRVQSMRPRLVSDGGGGVVAGGVPPSDGWAMGPSLRGMAATFFTQPSQNRRRIPSCPTGSGSAACAQQTALDFCRRTGQRFVGNVRQETVRGQNFLADVLCRNSAG
jgi:hypothetical protein